jgi:LPXTG-motif cell wall-anchored protein
LIAALAIPVGAAESKSSFALKGEARGLELAIGNQGVTLGFALAQADSAPSSLGVGAGQCELLGPEGDPDDLPCSDANTAKSSYPGNPGDADMSCSGSLPSPLSDVVDLKLACGSSQSALEKDVATTSNKGLVSSLEVKLPVGLRLLPLELPVEQVEEIVDTLTGVLAPVLDQAPGEVREALTPVEGTVDSVLELIQGIDATDAVKVELGTSTSNVIRKGSVISVNSEAAGAKIGLIGIPGVDSKGATIQQADPLTNGLVIIEVGTARASASATRGTASSTSAASAALVTVKVRDITKTEPTYVEVSVAPGKTETILEGTPAESTITAADSTTEQTPGSAKAAADAVRLHLLKGVNGGVKLGIAGANAAATADLTPIAAAPPVVKNRPPLTLPQTGARNMSVLAGLLVLAALGAFALRRRFTN